MTPKIIKTTLMLSGLNLICNFAIAGVVADEGDWTLSEVSTSSGVQCVASNKDSSWFRSEVYYLEITKLKNSSKSPAEIILRVENNKRGTGGFFASIKGASSRFVFTKQSTQQKVQNFVGIGSNLSQFVELLKKNDEDIEIVGVGGSDSIDFSNDGDGFKEIISAMEKRCNSGASLTDSKFESLFFQNLPKTINPLKVTAAVTEQLRALHFSAYDLYLQGKAAQGALDVILAKYSPFLRELEKVTANISQIENVDLPKTREILANAQKQQVDSQAEINRLTALIPSLETTVQQSQRSYDEVYAILAPHIPEHNRISNRLGLALTALQDAENRYSFIVNRLSQLSSDLSSLDREADQLEYSLSSQRSNLSSLRSNLQDAERRRSGFDVSYERDRRLGRDSEHGRLKDERQRLNSSLSDADRDVSQIHGERERIKRSLEQCKATVPAIDCSQFEKALDVANSQVDQKEKVKIEISRRLNEVVSRLSDIENAIDRQVRNEYDDLVRREEEIRHEFNRVDDIVRQNESRVNQIRNSEIPQREREQSQLINEKPQVSAQIRDYNEVVDRSRAELENFRRSTDWDRKADAVNKADVQLKADQSKLAKAKDGKKAAEKSLQEAQLVEKQSKEKIESLTARLAELNTRSLELNTAIKPLAEERAPLDKKITELKQALADARVQFLERLGSAN